MLYLSNPDPIKVEQTSTEGVPEPYRRDRNLDNNELKINNKNLPRACPALPYRAYLRPGRQIQAISGDAGVDDCVEGDECK